MSQITVNKGIFKNLQEFHDKKKDKVCNSRQAKSYRLKNLAKTARLLSTQNGVNSIIYYFAENEKGHNSVSGMAFGEKAEKFLASPKAVKFSQHFRKSFSVEEITMCNVEAEEETSTGKKTSLGGNEITKHLNNTEETCSTEVLKEITNLVGIADDQTSGRNLASQKAIEYSLHRKHRSEEMTFDLESDEETSLTGNKRSNAAGNKSKKDLKNTDGLTCSTSLSVAQPSGTNKEIVEEISSQGEVLKRKRQPKGKKIVQAKQAKPKNGKKNSKAHEATKNILAESASCDVGVSLTENVFATQTENEGFLAREDGCLITDVVAEESSGYIENEPSCGLSAASASIENVVAGTKVSKVKRIIESSSDSESEMKGQSSIQATGKSKNASRINEKKKQRYHPFFRFSEFPNQKKVKVVVKVIGFHVLYLSS